MKFACEWTKTKLYFKDHERKLLIGSLIGQTPSEPLCLFLALTLSQTFAFVRMIKF